MSSCSSAAGLSSPLGSACALSAFLKQDLDREPLNVSVFNLLSFSPDASVLSWGNPWCIRKPMEVRGIFTAHKPILG